MMQGIRGRLISSSFAREILVSMPGATPPPAAFGRAVDAWSERVEATLGPASSVRSIADVAVLPLLRMLELDVASRIDAADCCLLQTACAGRRGPGVIVAGWQQPLSRGWRTAVLRAIANDLRWSLVSNGTALRVVDSRRTWSRDFLEFDLRYVAREPECQALLWTLLRGTALTADPPLLDHAVMLSSQHGAEVCRALGRGALDALALIAGALNARPRSRAARERPDGPAPEFEQSLIVLYRVLFLLFAEARGLVPMWHPVYRDRYSLDAIVTALLAGRPCKGLWKAVQAISRLAHGGCSAGELQVNAFNGRLFATAETAALARCQMSDAVMAGAITAVSSREIGRGGERGRIQYSDLDVEQLGAIYEQVLELEPLEGGVPAARSRDVRKSSGTFYTPRQVTAFLVRRTLAPLVQNRSASAILSLRVVDPAMGSGAFLVAACRYLASAAEEALIRDGQWHAGDVTAGDRVALRREIALRCLHGVDLNPMAVQLARLSIWLTTLSVDRPLSFLDHHLVAGDSLVGARLDDVQRRPGRRRAGRRDDLPLFGGREIAPTIESAVRVRLKLALEPDSTPDVVREKERALAALSEASASLTRWSRLLDLWCSSWFWEHGARPDPGLFSELSDRILSDRSSLPGTATQPFLDHADAIARRQRFLHWPLAFPEAFADDGGRPLANPGFDALVGNPPWDMVRGDSGADAVRASRRRGARQLTDFVRESGVYRVSSRAHVNRYQLFLERALQLVRSGGRIGLVLPSGIASDAGAAALRRHLFDRADVDSITGLDNRAGVFPIHRSVRFALLTCTVGAPTETIVCRFGLSDPDHLQDDQRTDRPPIVVTRRLLARLSGDDDLGIPEVATEHDLRIVEKIGARTPWLGSDRGWSVAFGRELNASDDRGRFRPFRGGPDARPVVEGKQIEPFRVSLELCRLELRPGGAPARIASHARLAYRDIASATNRLTLIAAVIPARAVTTHTLFCLKTPLTNAEQYVLSGLLNSFVANYLVRLRVNTHVTVSLVSRLPVPVVRTGHTDYPRLLALSHALATSSAAVEHMTEYTELQALVARLYGLTRADFEHVLSTFPLVSAATRAESLRRFDELR